MSNGTRLRKETEWRKRLARYRRAGISVVEFCVDEGISTPSFYAWRRRLSGGAGPHARTDDGAAGPVERHGPFAAVRVTGAVNGGGLVTVALPGGTRLEIPLLDPSAAAALIGAIVQADAEQAGGRPC
jgi:hypothetical protein